MPHPCLEDLPERNQFMMERRARRRPFGLSARNAIFLDSAGGDGRKPHRAKVGIEMEPNTILMPAHIGGATLAISDDFILALKYHRRLFEGFFRFDLSPTKLPMQFKIPVMGEIFGV